jgi:hypothetical protein
MLTIEDKSKTQKLAQEALFKIRTQNLEEKLSKIPPKPEYHHMYESFDIDYLKTKLYYDAAYYNVILTECSKEQLEIGNNLIQDVYTDIKQIYQYMNIKPAIYGNRKLIHESSEQLLEENAMREISEYLNQQYYNLTPSERKKRFKVQIVEETQILLKKDVSIEKSDAIDQVQKRIIYENLINTISFPGPLKYTLEERKINDVDLEELVLTFENHVFELSTLFSKVK